MQVALSYAYSEVNQIIPSTCTENVITKGSDLMKV